MTTDNAEIYSRLRAAGLEVINSVAAGRPSVTEAFRRVVNVEVKPVQRISAGIAKADQKAYNAWKTHAQSGGVLADDGTFLVAGSLKHEWIHVRLTDAINISALKDPDGELLFVTRSASGHRVCAVSKEGGEYWILVEDFS
ncbi:hypothetical protein GCM10010389_36350 [Streptomyces echinoruber]|uniref:Uncharacterized protein n=1 Tax=Streptomyces echinoruber TaxID=68898 RepID=A0A918RF55_9ACTN|nr:hypothetical protein GCM10010389_36350 [Streptomyces echinoruber]